MGALVAGGQQRRSRGAVVDIVAVGGVAWVSKRRGLMPEERAFKEASHTRS